MARQTIIDWRPRLTCISAFEHAKCRCGVECRRLSWVNGYVCYRWSRQTIIIVAPVACGVGALKHRTLCTHRTRNHREIDRSCKPGHVCVAVCVNGNSAWVVRGYAAEIGRIDKC